MNAMGNNTVVGNVAQVDEQNPSDSTLGQMVDSFLGVPNNLPRRYLRRLQLILKLTKIVGSGKGAQYDAFIKTLAARHIQSMRLFHECWTRSGDDEMESRSSLSYLHTLLLSSVLSQIKHSLLKPTKRNHGNQSISCCRHKSSTVC
jgi:hypothetical protein